MSIPARLFPDSPPATPPTGLAGSTTQPTLSRPTLPPSMNSFSEKKPNILYIMADQLAAPLLKWHDPNSKIKTPNLNALAEKAVIFDSAYTPSPLCAPSRMSMVTGQLPSKIAAYDNACSIDSAVPTYAHYLRNAGYETVLAGKMHFIGDQLHGYEKRLTPDIYPADYGWSVSWDNPNEKLEWYHSATSITQAGPCVRTNQLDYDEEVIYKSSQFLYDHARKGPDARPFCLTLSLTHPHDPYCIEQEFWDLYEDVEIDLPKCRTKREDLDPHSKRLLHVTDVADYEFTDEQIKRARRAYYGAVSYVDHCVGRIMAVLKKCRMDENTIIAFSGDHGDMLGEKGLWYKMSWFEGSARVPMFFHYPQRFAPHRVSENVSTLDMLPTLVDIVGTKLIPSLPMDGISMMRHLTGIPGGHDTVFGEYMGEGTVAPMMMIRRGPWKYITCPADPPQLYNLANDALEVVNLATNAEGENKAVLDAFEAEAKAKWNMPDITEKVVISQRQRRFVWDALNQGTFTSWDWRDSEDSTRKYIRSFLPLDDLELKARYPQVDFNGMEIQQPSPGCLKTAPAVFDKVPPTAFENTKVYV